MAEKKYLDENGLLYVWGKIKTLLADKVDKEEGKGLSTNDLTDELKQKILNAGDSSFDGQYGSLTGKPSINGVELKSGANTLAELGIQASETGKGLSTNDFTDDDKSKLDALSEDADENIIETIKVNGVAQTVTDKAVDITVPTKTSQLTNDSDFVTDTELNDGLDTKVDKEDGKGLSTNDFTTAEKNKLTGIEEGAQVNVIEKISVNGTEQTVTNKTVDITISAGAEYTIAEVTTAEGFSKTYSLTKDGTEIGAKINIPKDLVVESGSVKTAEGSEYDGAVAGEKYIELVLNDSTKDKIIIPLKDLAVAYTAGNGISIGSDNEVSVVVDSSSANGLSLSATGLALGIASTTENGAMTSTMVTKLNGIEEGAEENTIETIKINGVVQAPTDKAVDITVPTKVSELTNDSKFVTDTVLADYVKSTDIVAITNAEIDTIFSA